MDVQLPDEMRSAKAEGVQSNENLGEAASLCRREVADDRGEEESLQPGWQQAGQEHSNGCGSRNHAVCLQEKQPTLA